MFDCKKFVAVVGRVYIHWNGAQSPTFLAHWPLEQYKLEQDAGAA